jgi:hypothetical protein
LTAFVGTERGTTRTGPGEGVQAQPMPADEALAASGAVNIQVVTNDGGMLDTSFNEQGFATSDN